MGLADILAGGSDSARAEAPPARRALAYARVSTDDQERAGLSIPAQIKAIHQYARTKGIEIVEVFEEAGSAFSEESRRPEFWRMVARAKADAGIDAILVHDHSRFFRDPYAGPQVKGELLGHGVRVISVSEPEFDPRTVAGLAVEKMTEFTNAAYSLQVAFHTRKGMRENVERRDPETGHCYKNGGAPPWGFQAYRVPRGTDRRGEAIQKTLWRKDETIAAGRAVWEWARMALVDLRLGEQASLDRIRDALNERGVPAPRKAFWGTSTVHTLLRPPALLQYAGYGVWNAHGKRGRHNPPSEWVIVERAHPAIITLDEAEAILAVNDRQRRVGLDRSKGRMAAVRAHRSRYLLTGGLLMCRRCGANMVGYVNQGRPYYVCGSKVYRKGLGCGPALQIRKEEIEDAVVEEVGRLFDSWADTKRLLATVNEELRALRQAQAAEAVEISRRMAQVDEELSNVRAAVQRGLEDLEWANEALRRLKAERETLLVREAALSAEPEVPPLDLSQVEAYRRRFAEVFARGTNEEKRELARLFVQRIEADPRTGDVWMHLFSRPPALASPRNVIRTPAGAGVRIGLVAGGGFEPPTFGL